MYSYIKGAVHATVLILFASTCLALDKKCKECDELKEQLKTKPVTFFKSRNATYDDKIYKESN